MSSSDDQDGQWGSEPDIDRQIRREFARTFGEPERPMETLQALRPSIRRARTVHRLQRVAVGVAGAAVVVVGLGAVAQRMSSDELGLTVAGDVDGASTDDPTQGADGGHELEVSGTTTAADAGADDAGTDSAGGSDSTAGSAMESSTPTTATAPTTSPSSTTNGGESPPTTDPDSTTSIQADGSIAVITECGRLIVALDGGELDLIEVLPDPGFRTDVKASKSNVIEVGFEREHRQCEVKIRPSGADLDIDVESEDHREDH